MENKMEVEKTAVDDASAPEDKAAGAVDEKGPAEKAEAMGNAEPTALDDVASKDDVAVAVQAAIGAQLSAVTAVLAEGNSTLCRIADGVRDLTGAVLALVRPARFAMGSQTDPLVTGLPAPAAAATAAAMETPASEVARDKEASPGDDFDVDLDGSSGGSAQREREEEEEREAQRERDANARRQALEREAAEQDAAERRAAERRAIARREAARIEAERRDAEARAELESSGAVKPSRRDRNDAKRYAAIIALDDSEDEREAEEGDAGDDADDAADAAAGDDDVKEEADAEWRVAGRCWLKQCTVVPKEGATWTCASCAVPHYCSRECAMRDVTRHAQFKGGDGCAVLCQELRRPASGASDEIVALETALRGGRHLIAARNADEVSAAPGLDEAGRAWSIVRASALKEWPRGQLGPRPTCGNAHGRHSCRRTTGPLLACAACHGSWYCCAECAAAAWPRHALICDVVLPERGAYDKDGWAALTLSATDRAAMEACWRARRDWAKEIAKRSTGAAASTTPRSGSNASATAAPASGARPQRRATASVRRAVKRHREDSDDDDETAAAVATPQPLQSAAVVGRRTNKRSRAHI